MPSKSICIFTVTCIFSPGIKVSVPVAGFTTPPALQWAVAEGLAMGDAIALALGVAVQQVNVKAKTAEKLGPVGMGQSMEARAVALLSKR